ncbi:MAG: hypothetical protein HYV09_31320 [Deltaproteobacteria bacterium]|nr:hypothetical protein [Deltaproteobacteria bacterium]
MSDRRASLSRLAAAGACGALAYALCVLAPLRPQTSDTTPGFLGAIVLACHGDQDLSRVPWVDAQARNVAVPYWATITADGRGLVSTFGPGPAALGRPALLGLRPGDAVEEDALRGRVRNAAAASVGVATAFACLAALAWAPTWIAMVAALVAACSFAGAPNLGQGLWQQTAALPALLAALAGVAWTARSRAATVLAPAAAVLAVLLRPADAPLSVALLTAWWLRARATPRVDRLAALALLSLAAAPLLLWNLDRLGSPLPTGQWVRNAAQTEQVFALAPARLFGALAGLLVSPARGLVIFAPLAIVGVVVAWRSRDSVLRVLALGVVGQLLLAASFFKWWGGMSFGPRLLAGATWLAIVLAATQLPSPGRLGRRARAVVLACALLTGAVGLAGTFGFEVAQWELPNDVDRDPRRLWQLADSPLRRLFTTPPKGTARPGRAVFCPEGPAGRWALGPGR